MILSKNQAKSLNMNKTIDLKKIILESEWYVYCPNKKYDFIYTYLFLFWLINFISTILYIFYIFIFTKW